MADEVVDTDEEYARRQEAFASRADGMGKHDEAELYRADADLTRRLAAARASGDTDAELAVSYEYRAFRQTWREIRDAFGTHQTHYGPGELS